MRGGRRRRGPQPAASRRAEPRRHFRVGFEPFQGFVAPFPIPGRDIWPEGSRRVAAWRLGHNIPSRYRNHEPAGARVMAGNNMHRANVVFALADTASFIPPSLRRPARPDCPMRANIAWVSGFQKHLSQRPKNNNAISALPCAGQGIGRRRHGRNGPLLAQVHRLLPVFTRRRAPACSRTSARSTIAGDRRVRDGRRNSR